MLAWLKIRRFRNVLADSEIVFDPERVLLLGYNGSGKTTLLRIISMIARHDFSEIAGEEFWFEYVLEGRGARTTVVVKNERETLPDRPFPTDKVPGLSSPRELFHARVVWSYEGPAESRWVLRGENGQISIERGGMTDHLHVQVSPLSPAFLWSLASHVEPAVWLWNHNNAFRFDEGLDTFRAVLGEGSSDTPRFSLEASIHGGDRADLERSDFVATGWVAPLLFETKGTRPTEQDVGSIRELASTLGFKEARARLEIVESARNGDFEHLAANGLRFKFTRADGSTIGHELLSYGQKRIVAFYYYLAANNDGPIIADELVNGLHHRWIEECLKQIGPRQAFLTSQNPVLLDYIGFDTAESAERRFVQCSKEVVDGKEMLRWANISSEDAKMLAEARDVGLQQVSEILRTRGLW